MTVDPLDLLRSIDPLPHGSSAPPLERVLAEIDARDAPPGRRHGGRWGSPWRSWMIPALGAAAAIAVVAVVVVLGLAHHRAAPAQRVTGTTSTPTTPSTPPAVPSPQSLDPRGGMPGMLLILGAAATSPDQSLISFGQCHPCHGGGAGRGSATHDWAATTTDGGATWHVAQVPFNLGGFAFAGADAWAEGLESGGHGDGGYARIFASHDGGRSWSVAATAAPAPGGVGDVSIAGGEVWSLGEGCAGQTCTDTILHGAASGARLVATPGQPPLGDDTNVSVVATGRDGADVLADDYGTNPRFATIVRSRLFRTSDGGRTWQALPTPCRGSDDDGRLYGGGPAALWAVCEGRRGAELRRSTDGGHTWATVLRPPTPDPANFQPVSASVAWLLTARGAVLRTADGGQTWTTVWDGGRPEPAVLAGNNPVLAVHDATTATVVAVVTRGRVDGHAGLTNFVAYTTTDGGRSWRPRVVLLPAR